jgi:hypothetical protein
MLGGVFEPSTYGLEVPGCARYVAVLSKGSISPGVAVGIG